MKQTTILAMFAGNNIVIKRISVLPADLEQINQNMYSKIVYSYMSKIIYSYVSTGHPSKKYNSV